MENFDQPLDVGMPPASEDGLRITDEVRMYWHQIGRWAMFFAVLMFIVFGLLTLTGLMMLLSGPAVGIISGLFMIAIYAGLMFFPALYYYRFSTQMKQALSMDDNSLLDEAFTNLRRFYRYVGILVIIVIAVYLLIFIVFGAALMRGGMMGD